MVYSRKSIKVYSTKKVTDTGTKAVNEDIKPNTGIVVQASPYGDETLGTPGTKCEHGVYIPASASNPNLAPFCSFCYRYLIKIN